MPRAHEEDSGLLGPLQSPNWVKVCLVFTDFFLPVSIKPGEEKCLGLSVVDRILCLRVYYSTQRTCSLPDQHHLDDQEKETLTFPRQIHASDFNMGTVVATRSGAWDQEKEIFTFPRQIHTSDFNVGTVVATRSGAWDQEKETSTFPRQIHTSDFNMGTVVATRSGA